MMTNLELPAVLMSHVRSNSISKKRRQRQDRACESVVFQKRHFINRLRTEVYSGPDNQDANLI